MFILTRPIKPTGSEPFLPPPPYDPKTGEPSLGIPVHEPIVRPRIRKGEKDLIPFLKKMDNAELEKLIADMSDREVGELIRKLLEKIKK